MADNASVPLLPPTPAANKTLSLDRMRQLQCHAAECHSFGAIPEAIHAWSTILRQLVPHLVDDRSFEEDDDNGDGGAYDDRAGFGGPVHPAPEAPVELWIAPVAHTPNADDAIFALFPYVLVYNASHQGGPNDKEASGSNAVRRMGAGVAYNLALAYHMQSLQGPGRHAAMKTALSAYKAAKDMLLSAHHDSEQQRLWRPSQSGPSEDDRLLMLAITNNEGQIREALHERAGVVEALDGLRRGLTGAANPAGICGHFTITDSLFGDCDVVHSVHSAAA